MICEDDPAIPVVGLIVNPATRPSKLFRKFSLWVPAISLPPIFCAEYPNSLGFLFISITTVTSPMVLSLSLSGIDKVFESPTFIDKPS